MCGILGYYNRSGISNENLRECLAALKRVAHRGPDGEGGVLINTVTGEFNILRTDETPAAIETNFLKENYQEGSAHLFLGHRRLSIIDLSLNGHQPMKDESGNWIIFNGELYNYIEVREELKKMGRSFRTESDTEVFHKAYLEWGEKCLAKFNGMWAFVLWDHAKKKLFISNDRFGVKPLFYVSNEKELILGSEMKQFFDFKGRVGGFNRKNIQIFLDQTYLDHDRSTLFENVNRFSPAHYSILDIAANKFSLSEKEMRPYYAVNYQVNNSIKETEAIEKFRELLYSSIKLRLRADVPIGFALSGGLDSSAVLYTSRKIFKDQGNDFNVKTFSAVFPGMEADESKFIDLLKQDLKCDSAFVVPMTDFKFEDLEKHIYHEERPLQTTAFFAQWSVDELVKKNNFKILFVGQGADEVFAGYHHHFYRYCRSLIMHGKIKKYYSILKQYAELKGKDKDQLHKIIVNDVKLKLKLKFGLSGIDSALQKKWNSASGLIDILKLDFSEYMLPTYLCSDDHNAMAHSIETRHPFMDYRLVDLGFSLPDHFKIRDGWQKWIIRQAMNELPEVIRFRKDKKGFSTPQNFWLEKYRAQFESYLPFVKEQGFQYSDAAIFRAYSLGAFIKIFKGNINQ